ncbi:MAG: GNAT family N-acetyltransferase [Actinomycetota bacterium]|nr:GNAT family N-acetyltransferase [Actinomycetota bacterium]
MHKRPRWYLEMTALEQLRPARPVNSRLELRRCDDLSLFRAIHWRVATPHGWSSLRWSDERWAEEFERPCVQRWIAQVGDEAVGIGAVDMPRSGDFEITDFGLVPENIGRGLGGQLLSVVMEMLWGAGARRIWLHTQYSDHEHALQNYLSRGFNIFQTEEAPPRP